MGTNKKNNWGGARAGAGHPLPFGVATIPVGVRIPPEQAARLRAMAEAAGLSLGVFLVRLADYWEEGHRKPETSNPHPIPDAVEGCRKPDINPTRL